MTRRSVIVDGDEETIRLCDHCGLGTDEVDSRGQLVAFGPKDGTIDVEYPTLHYHTRCLDEISSSALLERTVADEIQERGPGSVEPFVAINRTEMKVVSGLFMAMLLSWFIGIPWGFGPFVLLIWVVGLIVIGIVLKRGRRTIKLPAIHVARGSR